jgi:competence protein ComEC
MRAVWCGFALGVVWLQQQAVLPGVSGWPALAALAGGAICVAGWLLSPVRAARWTTVAGWCAVWLAAGCGGFGYAAWRAELRLAVASPAAWEARSIVVDGSIKSLPTRDENGARFLFQVDSNDAHLVHFPHTIQLAWITEDTPPPSLEPGAPWRLSVRLKRPHGNANFGVA